MARALLVLLMVHAAASQALAQVPAPLDEAEGGVMTMVWAIGIIIVTGLSSVINPKRTHMT